MQYDVSHLFSRWADKQTSPGTNPRAPHSFNHPYFQVIKGRATGERMGGGGGGGGGGNGVLPMSDLL